MQLLDPALDPLEEPVFGLEENGPLGALFNLSLPTEHGFGLDDVGPGRQLFLQQGAGRFGGIFL
jgi:hypothetical protein